MSKLWTQLNEIVAGEELRHRKQAQDEAATARAALDQAIAIREDASELERTRFAQAQQQEAFFKEYGGDPPIDLTYEFLAMGNGEPYDVPFCNWVSPLEYDEGMG